MSAPVTDPHAHDPSATTRDYRDLIADCVHCGFCLPACPTYNSWGEEMDSPRGRIDLMKGVADEIIPLDALVAELRAFRGTEPSDDVAALVLAPRPD